MPDWVLVALGFIAVPLVAIIGFIGVLGFGIWVIHKNRMARLEVEEKERQAELDRELLGLGSKEISANMQVILDRLNALESRMDRLETMDRVEAAKARGRIPLGGGDEVARPERRQDETNIA